MVPIYFIFDYFSKYGLIVFLFQSKTLVREEKCIYYFKAPNLKNHLLLKSGSAYHQWDIEDLVRLGKKSKGLFLFSS